MVYRSHRVTETPACRAVEQTDTDVASFDDRQWALTTLKTLLLPPVVANACYAPSSSSKPTKEFHQQ